MINVVADVMIDRLNYVYILIIVKIAIMTSTIVILIGHLWQKLNESQETPRSSLVTASRAT